MDQPAPLLDVHIARRAARSNARRKSLPVPCWLPLALRQPDKFLENWQPGLSLDQQPRPDPGSGSDDDDRRPARSPGALERGIGRRIDRLSFSRRWPAISSKCPASFRQVRSCPGDPAASTVPGELTIAEPDDLLLWLPDGAGPSRFEPGVQPLADAPPGGLEELLRGPPQ